MNRIFSAIAIACLVGTAGLSAQMKHVDLKDAKGASVGMAMISPAKGGAKHPARQGIARPTIFQPGT